MSLLLRFLTSLSKAWKAYLKELRTPLNDDDQRDKF